MLKPPHPTLRQRLRYQWALLSRRQNYLFTQFRRVPTQLAALTGPVLRDWLHADRSSGPVRIASIGCSIGAEPYTVACTLAQADPAVDFRIRGFDLDAGAIERACAAVYTQQELDSGGNVSADFRDRLFEPTGDGWRVRPQIAARVSFARADVLDPDLPKIVGESDIVLAQNMLYHFPPRTAAKAFRNICKCLAPRAALFVDGMDVGLRARLTRALKLAPLDFEIEQMHEEARSERGSCWPYIYWSLEPLDKRRADWRRRYATIFLR